MTEEKFVTSIFAGGKKTKNKMKKLEVPTIKSKHENHGSTPGELVYHHQAIIQ